MKTTRTWRALHMNPLHGGGVQPPSGGGAGGAGGGGIVSDVERDVCMPCILIVSNEQQVCFRVIRNVSVKC